MQKVLLIEDDGELADSLMQRLEMEGFEVVVCSSGNEGLEALKTGNPDLAVVDWDLPGISGVEIISAYRRAGGLAPIIMLTGKADLASKETGLDLGADDYLPKPFITAELLARLRSILRRPAQILPDRITIGTFQIDFKLQEVSVDAKSVQLSRMEFAVLQFLFAHPCKMFNSGALVESVWSSESESSDEAVRTCISRLRKKITDSQGNCILETGGSGYVIKWSPLSAGN